MNAGPPRIFPLGDNAITVEFGNEISEELNQAAISLAEHVSASPFPGFVEAVPAYSSATFYYRISEVLTDERGTSDTAFEIVRRRLLEAIERSTDHGPTRARARGS